MTDRALLMQHEIPGAKDSYPASDIVVIITADLVIFYWAIQVLPAANMQIYTVADLGSHQPDKLLAA